MANQNFAFGIDLSRYNTSADGRKKVDFNIIAAHAPEVVFIAMRAGISWGYQDPWFAYYMQEAQRIKRIRMAYHVLFPGESPIAQMDNFFRILGDVNFDHVPLVLDLELDHGHTVSTITSCTADAIRKIQQRTGRTPFIYSRASWVEQHLRVSGLPPVYWWLAQYRWPWPYPLYTPEHIGPPDLPPGVTTWHIHQTASRGASIGAPAMHFMDYNRWSGSKQDMIGFLGLSAQEPILCPIDQRECGRIFV